MHRSQCPMIQRDEWQASEDLPSLPVAGPSPETIPTPVQVCEIPAVTPQSGGPAGRARLDACGESVRLSWNRFGPMFAAETCK